MTKIFFNFTAVSILAVGLAGFIPGVSFAGHDVKELELLLHGVENSGTKERSGGILPFEMDQRAIEELNAKCKISAIECHVDQTENGKGVDAPRKKRSDRS